MRMIRMMCTGMVDPKYVVKALLEGADGVLISGCHPGDCHYINGNLKARRRVKLLQEILPQFGFDQRRVKLTWIGASEGIDFARTVKELVTEIRALGPSDVRQQMVL
jgi:coenzyme F420-reducing hydrogenase delta subunit